MEYVENGAISIWDIFAFPLDWTGMAMEARLAESWAKEGLDSIPTKNPL